MNPQIIKMYKDVVDGAEYTVSLNKQRLDSQKGTYTVFEGWNNTKIALRFLHGSKALQKHELPLRNKFVCVYKKLTKE
jgi:hypothetical protein